MKKTTTKPLSTGISNFSLLNFRNLFVMTLFAALSIQARALPPSYMTYFVNDASTTGDVYCTAVGNDANSGTESSPFATVTHAISVASAGDLIIVDVGTYNEHVSVTKSVRISGAGNATVFTPSSPCTGANTTATDGFVIFADHVDLEFMYIHGYDRGVVVYGKYSNLLFVKTSNNCTSGVELGHGIHHVSVQYCTINNNPVGVRASTGAQMHNIDLKGNSILKNILGTYIAAKSSGGNLFDTIEIRDNIVKGNYRRGLYFEKLSNALISCNTLDSNGTSASDSLNAGIDINLHYGSYSNITIKMNSITNCGFLGSATNVNGPGAVVVKARTDGANGGTLSGLDISNNFIHGPVNGLRLGQIGGANTSPTGVTIFNNHFGYAYSNKAMINMTTVPVAAATCNWFGTVDAPTVAGKIMGAFTYTPYLVDGTDTHPGCGFQPSSPTLSVNLGPDKLVYYGYTLPYNSDTLTPVVSGGSGYYSYLWSPGGATSSSIIVAPTDTTLYTVTVTDLNGCVAGNSDSKWVNAEDVRCDDGMGGTVIVCRWRFSNINGVQRTTLCVAEKSVAKYLLKGDLGPCSILNKRSAFGEDESTLSVYPNPSSGKITLELPNVGEVQNIRIINSMGQIVYKGETSETWVELNLDHLTKGLYYVECINNYATHLQKLIIE
ncbi:MAG: T9SS type A sorting domain-containing protein [Flavobacteriales bacterium]|nr:T9SS type A sorting domain-containing protein [Flavobacteriales bacterium]